MTFFARFRFRVPRRSLKFTAYEAAQASYYLSMAVEECEEHPGGPFQMNANERACVESLIDRFSEIGADLYEATEAFYISHDPGK